MKTFFLIFALLSGSVAVVQTDTGTLTGIITDAQTGKPIAGATVEIFQSGVSISTAKSDANGKYTLQLQTGTYDLKATASGYDLKVVKGKTIEAGKTSTSHFSLNATQIIEVESDDYYVRESACKQSPSTVSGNTGYYGGGAYDQPYIEHNTESYDVINENAYKAVINDPLSTFSVDVDRASYSNIRRFLTQNQKPPIDAVRIEEMINYFDYDYPQPKDGHPFSVTVEGGKCPWNENHQLVLVGLKGENINESEIPANNLVFLIDVSGSMGSANKLPLVKQSLKFLVEQLRPQDRVAIVVYAGAAGLVLPSTPGSQKEKIIASIDLLESGGSTAGGAGIKLAYQVAKENFIPNGNNRVILASDGDFNVGASSDAEMVRLIEERRDDGVFLTILGFGMGNYKDSKFEQLSNAGNGNYAYIDNILEAKKVFGVELWGTLYTIAKDVKIQIEFNPSKVKGYRLIGYENRILNKEDFNNDKKDAGDIGCGHTVTALYEIILADSDEQIPGVDPLKYQSSTVNSSNEMMNVKIRYKKPNGDVSILIEKPIKAGTLNATGNLWFASAIAEMGMLLRDSEFKGTSSFAQLIKRAKEFKGLDEYGFRSDFIKMAEMAELLYK